MKRISLLWGLKDRTLAEKALAEEYSLKQIIQAAVNRESSRANVEALRNRPTGNVNQMDEVEGQYKVKGGSLEARLNHLQVEQAARPRRETPGTSWRRAVKYKAMTMSWVCTRPRGVLIEAMTSSWVCTRTRTRGGMFHKVP